MVDVRGARIVRMLDDPAVGGDLLLVGIAMAAQLDFQGKWIKFEDVARQAFGEESGSYRKAWWVVKDDIRRYCMPRDDRAERRCQGPMPRAPYCRRSATWRTVVSDWETGERSPLVACNRHYDWFNKVHKENRDAKPDIVPLAPANAGGALRAHLPEIDWPRLWLSLDSKWVEHPEKQVWPKPTLEVIIGGGLQDDDVVFSSDGKPTTGLTLL